jgi:hypothetical protein
MEAEADCGEILQESFVRYCQNTSSWKTYRESLVLSEKAESQSLLLQLGEFSETWPSAGMMRNGECFPLENSVLGTYENDFLSLPTPGASENRDRANAVCLARLDRGGRVARRVCKHGIESGLTLPGGVVGASPWFLELMMGFPQGWTRIGDSECSPLETL